MMMMLLLLLLLKKEVEALKVVLCLIQGLGT
jgi:hypothetical protein